MRIKLNYIMIIILCILSTINFSWAQRSGGLLTFGVVASTYKSDPLYGISDNISSNVLDLTYNGLLRWDENMTLQPDLVENLPERVIKGGNAVYSMKLKENLRWHDDKPVTSEDVVFTVNVLKDPYVVGAPATERLHNLKECRKIDDRTIELVYYIPHIQDMATMTFKIIPKHIFEDTPNRDQTKSITAVDMNNNPLANKVVGTGPYKEMALTPNNAILNENEKYYLGDPYITTISMKCYNDDNNLVTESMVISNQFVPVIPRYYIARYENSPDWVIIKYNAPKYLYIGLNCARPPFNDKRFRQAIAKAVNKKEIKRSVYQDAGWIMWGPYPEQSPAYTTIQPHKFNPFKAKEELENLGFRDSDGDGFLDTNGKLLEISLLYNSHNQDYLRIAQIFQQNLQDIGIKVNFDGRGDAEIEQLCYFDKNFECVLNEVEIGIDPDIYKLFHSSQNQAGQSNYVSYSNPDVDHILSTARTMTNQNLRYSSYKDAARIIAEEVPYIFLWTGEICVGKSRKVHMPPNDINQVNIWDLIYKWWLD